MNTWFVAKRLFSHSAEAARVSRPAVRIATMGVAVGVAIMIVSVCVVLGFQNEIRSKLFGVGGHIQVINYESLGSEQYKPIVVDEELKEKLMSAPHVAHIQRFCLKPGMLKTDEAFRGVAFRGIGDDYDTTFLSDHLVEGELPHFEDSASIGKILVSKALAGQMELKVGSPVYAYFFENRVKARKFTVSGIYCTNLTDYDTQLVYCDINAVHRLLGWDTDQYSGVEVQLDSYDNLPQAMPYIVSHVNRTQDAYGAYYTSMTIREMYPQIFAWLNLLDMDVWAILVLMICVSGFTMVSGLLIIIMERTNFIGVMKAMGASNSLIRHIFLNFASFIILRGLVFGNLLAFALIGLQLWLGIVHLDPEVYYVDTMPILVNVGYVVVIDVVTLLVSVLSLVVPSYIISNIHPARSIRFE